ncbi:serine/threonine-protein kinase Sgk2, partial [Metarhizium majus ARSEF 297]
MAIGVLLSEQHSFMHDLESFFWVLFWICIHYNGPHETKVVPRFEKWNYVDTEELAGMKLGIVAKEAIFIKTIADNFTPYYEPLITLLNKLRKIVFPMDKPWEREDVRLYYKMGDLLRNEREGLTLDVLGNESHKIHSVVDNIVAAR